MASVELLLTTLLSVASGVAYGYVGWRLSRRRVEGPSRLASALFVTWWGALAVVSGLGAVLRLATIAGWVDLPLYLTMTHLVLLLLCLALWGLVYYLVYLLTGSRRSFIPITVGYGLLYVWYVFIVTAQHPQALVVEGSRVTLEYADPYPEGLGFLALAALLLPPMIAAVGYFRLYFQVEDVTQRYRIGMVSITIFAWFLSSAIASITQLSGKSWWSIVSAGIGLLAALLILAAYVPPAWVRERYGVSAVDERTSGE